MNTSPVPAVSSPAASPASSPADPVRVDPVAALESVAGELETLRSELGAGTGGGLVDLHGALYLYALDGDASLIPTVRFPFGANRLLQARVAWSARRLAQGAPAAVALERAAVRIEDLLHLIDPDLRNNISVAA